MKAAQTLRRQVGSLLIVGLAGMELSALEAAWLRTLQPAGIILFKRNLGSAKQVHALMQAVAKALRSEDQPAFFRCVDLEGGTVDRLRDLIGASPAAADVAATGKPEMYQRHGAIGGKMLAALGFNVDLAPVLDLATPACRAVMGTRVAAENPVHVAEYARGFLSGLAQHRVLGCGKHFPGLGNGTLDSHQATPKIARTWEQMQPDMAPYRALQKQLPFIMVNHAAYPKIERPAQPASLSKFWMTEVLRQQMGYRGLILSDDMEMGGVLSQASIEEAAIRAIAAGADVIEVCHQPDRILRAYEAVLAEAEQSPAFTRIVATASARVRRAQRMHLDADKLLRAATPMQIEKLRAELKRFSHDVAGAQ